MANAVKAELARVEAELPPGHELVVALDSSVFIKNAVRDVAVDIAYGALLAAAIVLVFLRSARSTLITGVAIPASLLASFPFFYFLGFTLNTMTLMALSLSIGLLIDDAIVVLESSYRHQEKGEAPAEAASRATEEVGLAVVASTLGVAAVFVPIAFMSGVVGRFFREFGLVATCPVLVSMLVALTLTPMLCARYLRLERRSGRAWSAFERVYLALERHYARTLAWGLRHRLAVASLALAAVAGGVAIASSVPIAFVNADDRSEFHVWLERPLGSNLEQTLFFRPFGFGRVGKAVVPALPFADPDGTFLRCRIADGHNKIKIHIPILIGRLGPSLVLNSNLGERSKCLRVDVSGRLCPGAEGLPAIAQPG